MSLPAGGHGRATSQCALFEIIHVVTEDLPDGQPWPPSGDAFWAIAARAHGLTRWRCIRLQANQPAVVALDGGLANQAAPHHQDRS